MASQTESKINNEEEFSKFDALLKQVISVPKKEIEAREKAEKQRKEKRKAKKS
jgi:hypothetical protein